MNIVEGGYGSRQFRIQYKPPLRNEVRFGGQHFVNSKYSNLSLDCVFVRRGYKTTVRESQIIGLLKLKVQGKSGKRINIFCNNLYKLYFSRHFIVGHYSVRHGNMLRKLIAFPALLTNCAIFTNMNFFW